MNDTKLYDALTAQFLICEEKIPQNGEDSGLIAFHGDSGLIGAFDGCGGLGALTYPNMNGKTGAYLSSRAVANAVHQWFMQGVDFRNAQNLLAGLSAVIDRNLKQCYAVGGRPAIRMKGSMIRAFPSTLAMILYHLQSDGLGTLHVWAGDSRTYILSSDGLAQVSVDDVKAGDEFSILSNDGVMTNVISADKPYQLHASAVTVRKPCILISATDGSFGYLSSPMKFEKVILECLLSAGNVVQWQERLKQQLGTAAEDDYTFALAAFGWESMDAMKADFETRYQTVVRLAEAFDAGSKEQQLGLWREYRKLYGQYQKQ